MEKTRSARKPAGLFPSPYMLFFPVRHAFPARISRFFPFSLLYAGSITVMPTCGFADIQAISGAPRFISAKFKYVEQFLAPFMLTVKAVPVASFVILILIWVSSKNLSIIISFLIVLPVIYTNIKDGISSCDKQLLEMAQVFRISPMRKIRYIYISQIMPFFRAACSISLGLCWKSGVAAEVIGIPKNSIGENLYNAKIYLDTPDLFAWTVVIILISLIFEKLFIYFLDKGIKRLERI